MKKIKTLTPKDLFNKLKSLKDDHNRCLYPLKKCAALVPQINEINELKARQGAVVLAHTYVLPEIIFGVADFVGDSYALSRDAIATDAKKIVFAAVRFMAETAKILNPQKEVLLPALDDGCTLADAITASDVRRLRKKYPEASFVCYVNTTAEVKAECDVCVTSANVYKVVQNIPQQKIYFLPDKLMGQNLANEMKRRGVPKDIRYYHGTCYVHEEFTAREILRARAKYPRIKVLCHPECKTKVCALCDFVGGTGQMSQYVRDTRAARFLILTEKNFSARLKVEFPKKKFLNPDAVCRYMKSNSLADILRVLKNPTRRDIVTVAEPVRKRALKCLEAMFYYTR
ncbi:MAG: quinolinate synthase NadA [Candidatus Omnitrophota bacterium]